MKHPSSILRRRPFIIIAILFCMFLLIRPSKLGAQFVMRPDTVSVKNDLPVFVEPLASDSLASSFVIVIDREVKAHFHAAHTEYVLVISGQALMDLGVEHFQVKAGDLIYIPKGTPHSVEVVGDAPLRVVSIQAPEFKGKDRIFVRPRKD